MPGRRLPKRGASLLLPHLRSSSKSFPLEYWGRLAKIEDSSGQIQRQIVIRMMGIQRLEYKLEIIGEDGSRVLLENQGIRSALVERMSILGEATYPSLQQQGREEPNRQTKRSPDLHPTNSKQADISTNVLYTC